MDPPTNVVENPSPVVAVTTSALIEDQVKVTGFPTITVVGLALNVTAVALLSATVLTVQVVLYVLFGRTPVDVLETVTVAVVAAENADEDVTRRVTTVPGETDILFEKGPAVPLVERSPPLALTCIPQSL